MARTRASKDADKGASSKAKDSAVPVSKYSLPAEASNPPQVIILPSKATPEARVVSLRNPRYSKLTRYLICPETGAYEFIKISARKTAPRSWLLEGSTEKKEGNDDLAEEIGDRAKFDAQVTKGADLFIATPVDPLFLALPALQAQFSSRTKRMFLSSDDHFDTIADENPHLRETLRWPRWREVLESRMAAVCDTAEAGDELMFRFSEDKLLDQMLSKAKKMSRVGLPKSLEDKFVNKALEAPVLGVKKMNPATTLQDEESTASETKTDPSPETTESQSSEAATAPTTSESVAATSVTDDAESVMHPPDDVLRLQQLRIAVNFICSSYLAPSMAVALKKMLADGKGSVDFTALDDYVAQLTKLRQEAMLSRSASDYSRKRTLDEDEEERRDKKRKKEEEEKRKKAGESRGVKELKKVNVAGMKKMSDFFKPKGPGRT